MKTVAKTVPQPKFRAINAFAGLVAFLAANPNAKIAGALADFDIADTRRRVKH